MEQFAARFLEGATRNGCAQGIARETWDNILKFGGYGFNKSHSTAYAVLTYQTAYLKANHRGAFLAANLSCEMSDSDKVKAFVDDARKAQIAVLPPAIGSSAWEFALEGEALRFGFGAIKGTGEKALQALLAARERVRAKGAPLELHELCAEIDPHEVGKTNLEALIKAGSFDASGHNRGAVLAALESALVEAARASADRKSGQKGLFEAAAEPAAPGGRRSDGIDDARAWSKQETLRAEYEVLGFYLSGHPLEERAGLLSLLSNVRMDELAQQPPGSEVTLAGLILGLSELVVKTGKMQGKKMARFRLEDLRGSVGVTCFPRTYEEQRAKIEEGAIVVCRGKLEEGSEEPALLLEEVLSVEEAIARFQGGIVLAVEEADTHLLEQLQQTIARHRGGRPVFLSVRGADGRVRRIKAGNEWNVSISEPFAREVDALLGRGRVRLARV
jgi:DNA polymerase-3 subunit alpha